MVDHNVDILSEKKGCSLLNISEDVLDKAKTQNWTKGMKSSSIKKVKRSMGRAGVGGKKGPNWGK